MADLKSSGRIDRITGRIKSVWGDVTDDDIQKSEGDIERLTGVIKEKTGDSFDAIREKLQGFFDEEEVESETRR